MVAGSAVFAAALSLDHREVTRIIGEREEAYRLGSTVLLVNQVPPDARAELRSACVRLSGNETIASAGGFSDFKVGYLTTYPGIAARRGRFDSEAWAIWFPETTMPPERHSIGDGLASRTGLITGDPLHLGGTPGPADPIGTVITPTRPFAQANEWIIETASPMELFSECWIEFRRTVTPADLAMVTTVLSAVPTYQLRPALPAGPVERDPASQFRSRDSRWAPVAAVAVLALLYCLIGFSRRGERALYVTLGLTRVEAYLMGVVEVAAAVVLPGLISSAAVLWFVADHGSVEASLATVLGLETQGLALVVTVLVLPVVGMSGRTATLLEDLRS